jgi:hypothetical protein
MDLFNSSTWLGKPSSFQERISKDGFGYLILFLLADTTASHLLKRRKILSPTIVRRWQGASNAIGATGLAYVGYCKYKVNNFESQLDKESDIHAPAGSSQKPTA